MTPTHAGPPALILTESPLRVAGQKPHFSPDALECLQSAVQMLAFERGRHLDADACGAFWHHGIAEAGDEDALLEQPVADLDGESGVADNDRDDGRFSMQGFVADLLEAAPEVARVLTQAVYHGWVGFQELDSLPG